MYVLHYRPDSAAMAVRLTLEELGQPYRTVLVDQVAHVPDSPAYRQLQPLGLVPALETPDGPMFETAAILLWLADRHGALAPAPEAPERAAFLKWFFFASTNVHPTLLQLFYPERVAGPDAIPAVLAKAHDRMHGHLRLLDAVAADRPAWLSPDRPSILGYYLGMLIRWLAGIAPNQPGHVGPADYPALRAVCAALESRPAAGRVAEAESLGPTIFTDPA